MNIIRNNRKTVDFLKIIKKEKVRTIIVQQTKERESERSTSKE